MKTILESELEKKVLFNVRHLNVSFGKGKREFKAVKDVSFQIYKGETFG